MASQQVVDVVAAARQLLAGRQWEASEMERLSQEAALQAHAATQSAPPPDPAVVVPPATAEAQRGTQRDCPLGHPNADGVRFCSECGMSMDAMVLTERVDLDAVRAAMPPAETPEARAERDRQHLDALAANARAEQGIALLEQQQDTSERKVTIHFIADGFTWAGQVWMAGQEISIGPQHPRWASAQPWITLSKSEQVERYGRVWFDQGPWPYRNMIAPGTEMPLQTAAASQWQRNRNMRVPGRPGENGSLIPD